MIPGMSVADAVADHGPWNPGILSQVPKELRHLATIFDSENVLTSLVAVDELEGLTGFLPSEIITFRPQRLALHELLIRVTADFAVPDGNRIEDLGINFRAIAGRLFTTYLVPHMDDLISAYEETRRQLQEIIEGALSAVLAGPALAVTPAPARKLLARLTRRPATLAPGASRPGTLRPWGPTEIVGCERLASAASDPLQRIAYRTLARVMSALFTTQGFAWGSREMIGSLATDMACNVCGSDAIGRGMEPLLLRAVREEGYDLLPPQERPIVINTKGASASGKSTLRPLQKKLAGDIGVRWSDFALISPDIWRKQLLDYGALGSAYKYAGAFSADELQIVDQKLDRYMARKYQRGGMTHLLIDRFRFDSFAPDSDEAGSNLLTRFGHTVYLFFVITPPESLVERAWNRGLEFGRYKAVDDTLAHAVEAYAGIPDVFFTWVRRSDKRIQFEFLDNTVPLGDRPRTVAFGDNDTFNVLDVKKILDVERYGRLNVNAGSADHLYLDQERLAPEHNTRFLKRCAGEFRRMNFAVQSTGRLFLRIEAGLPVWMDPAALREAIADRDTLAGINAVAPGALGGGVADADSPQYLFGQAQGLAPTLGSWGGATGEAPGTAPTDAARQPKKSQ